MHQSWLLMVREQTAQSSHALKETTTKIDSFLLSGRAAVYHCLLFTHSEDHNIIISKWSVGKQIKYPVARINDYTRIALTLKNTAMVFFHIRLSLWQMGERQEHTLAWYDAFMFLGGHSDHLTVIWKKSLHSSGFPFLFIHFWEWQAIFSLQSTCFVPYTLWSC